MVSPCLGAQAAPSRRCPTSPAASAMCTELPVILAGLRIVLVQNIGLAVIAALIGGGGFGTFVFQGLNQTATDLILLGALVYVWRKGAFEWM